MEVKHIPVLGYITGRMSDADMDYGPLMAFLAVVLFISGLFIFGVTTGGVISFLLLLSPIWFPMILFMIFYKKWMETVGLSFYLDNGRTTLRIIPPQEVLKSPEAMEFVISQIHNTANPDNLMQTYLDGKRPLPYSFEIVSIGGEIRIYVNVPTKKTRDAFEAILYAQYPGIEIVEEEVDYAAEVPLDDKNWTVFSAHMGKKKDGILPLKGYIEYGLDKMPKEEEKVDPMTPMLDVFASAKPHERIYMQIIATSVRPESFKNGQVTRMFSGEGPKWNEESSKKVDELMHRDPKTKAPLNVGEEDFDGSPRITPGERSLIETIERHSGKYAYSVGIRWVYLNSEGGFNSNLINPIIRSFSQWDGANQLGVRWRTDFNYKDLIPGGKKKQIAALKRQELKEYKMRKYFPKSQSDEPKIFTAEELASIFHVPGRVATTPTLTRIQSARSEAPSNLPTSNPNNG